MIDATILAGVCNEQGLIHEIGIFQQIGNIYLIKYHDITIQVGICVKRINVENLAVFCLNKKKMLNNLFL